MSRFGTWMRIAIEHGVAHVSETVWCNYPPGYLYLLKGTGLLWMTLSGLPLPADGTVAMRALVKLIPTIADLGGAWVLYQLAAVRRTRAAALVVLAVYAYNPALLFNSAVWGQADSLVALLMLVAVWAICSERIAVGFGVAAATVLVKLQAVVLLPSMLLVAWSIGGVRGILAAARGAALVALALLLPFFLAYRMDAFVATIVGASGLYPKISMNAHNVWWLIGGTRSVDISDAMRVGNGLLTYRSLGTAMLGTATLLILWRLWRDLYRCSRDPFLALVEASALEAWAFYLFPTEMHERYILPALVFAAAICIWRPRVGWVYGFLSGATLVSLAGTLNANYPANAQYPILLDRLAALLPVDRAETAVLSGLFVSLFVLLLLWTRDRRFRSGAPALVALAAVLVRGIAFVPLRQAAPLYEWEPIEQTQEWGTMNHNSTVEGRRLSVSGFIFRHGIGTHAASKLTYHLNGGFRSFDTAFGVDDEANRGQMIRFRILTDGYLRFDSGNISAAGFPRHVQVPVDGAEFLTLEVLDGGDGINSDHADWLEPVLLR